MNPFQTYISDLRAIHASRAAVKETSYYGALERLFNEVGKSLKPKVRCIINIKSKGAGIPDGGLFTVDQLRKTSDDDALASQLPARGCVEVKGAGENIQTTIKSKQVRKYLERYGQVLVTNYRDFALVALDQSRELTVLEIYHLAKNENDFWSTDPSQMIKEHEERFLEYLKRVMQHGAPLELPEDVAWFLASYAREARARIEKAELPALDLVRESLEEALGIKFTGEDGEHFFRSTLVQTLFYGVFSAWVLWSKQHSTSDAQARFEWQTAVWSLRVPMIKALYEQLATPSKLNPLGLVEVLNWTASVLNRVRRAEFFTRFEEDQAVQYFYEPFLKAFDPKLRKDLGVWYTPTEIVKYMVARVDTVLREELGLADGLADPNVYILDPCCGTGAYLVEVLRKIGETLEERGDDALLSYDLKKAAMERIYGFEILPAPFVVAHLQLGLMLQHLGAPLSESQDERVAVYLTNALTGWEPPKEPKNRLMFPELEDERDAAERVKRDTPILVIMGNPPYNAFAGVSPAEEQGLVEPYKEGLISEWNIKKFNLDDLYIRFFRLAERRIAEKTGKGVVSFISNHSWVSDPSYVVLRRHLLSSFDRFWIENMHGNRKISEYGPDGRTSETVFAIPGFSEGIKQGVAISLWVKTGDRSGTPTVLFRDDLNASKAVERREQLLESLYTLDLDTQYEHVHPEKVNRFSFRPSVVAAHYREWPRTIDLCAEAPSNGLMEKRRGGLIDIDKEALEKRMKLYYDSNVSWEALANLQTGLTEDAARYDSKSTRQKILSIETYNPESLQRYAIRPLETRWCYYSAVRPLWNEPRPALWAQSWDGNKFLLTRFKQAKDPEGPPFYYTQCLSDDHVLTPDAVAIPFCIRATPSKDKGDPRQASIFNQINVEDTSFRANLSELTHDYLVDLKIETNEDIEASNLIWFHVLAIGYSPQYLSENADGVRQDWPRIPLPANKESLLASAAIGQKLSALLDTENSVSGVSTGKIRDELRVIAVVSRAGKGSLHPDKGDLQLTAGWGHYGKDGITMPGKGRIKERDYTNEERAAIEKGVTALGLSVDQAFAVLGTTTYDVFLNDVAYWRNIPAHVWDYTIGGYQIIKKWLSYREFQLLGRSLTLDEVREVMNIARRLASILLLEPTLDANYQNVKRDCYNWPK